MAPQPEIIISRTVAPNTPLLQEELDALGYGSMFIGEPGNYPGNIHVQPDQSLTAQEEQDVIDTVTNHDETAQTAEQQRQDQDAADRADLVAKLDDIATLSDAEFRTVVQQGIRAALRAIWGEPV